MKKAIWVMLVVGFLFTLGVNAWGAGLLTEHQLWSVYQTSKGQANTGYNSGSINGRTDSSMYVTMLGNVEPTSFGFIIEHDSTRTGTICDSLQWQIVPIIYRIASNSLYNNRPIEVLWADSVYLETLASDTCKLWAPTMERTYTLVPPVNCWRGVEYSGVLLICRNKSLSADSCVIPSVKIIPSSGIVQTPTGINEIWGDSGDDLSALMATASDGDVIVLHPGTYSGCDKIVTKDVSIVASSSYPFQGDVTITGVDSLFDICSDISFSGVKITCTGAASLFYFRTATNDVRFMNCDIACSTATWRGYVGFTNTKVQSWKAANGTTAGWVFGKAGEDCTTVNLKYDPFGYREPSDSYGAGFWIIGKYTIRMSGLNRTIGTGATITFSGSASGAIVNSWIINASQGAALLFTGAATGTITNCSIDADCTGVCTRDSSQVTMQGSTIEGDIYSLWRRSLLAESAQGCNFVGTVLLDTTNITLRTEPTFTFVGSNNSRTGTLTDNMTTPGNGSVKGFPVKNVIQVSGAFDNSAAADTIVTAGVLAKMVDIHPDKIGTVTANDFIVVGVKQDTIFLYKGASATNRLGWAGSYTY